MLSLDIPLDFSLRTDKESLYERLERLKEKTLVISLPLFVPLISVPVLFYIWSVFAGPLAVHRLNELSGKFFYSIGSWTGILAWLPV